MTDIYSAQTDNHQDRTQAIRKLRESMQVSLKAELEEKLAFIENPIIPSENSEKDATPEQINQAHATAINLYHEIDTNEAFLKSWTPPPPINLPAITDEKPPPPNWLLENWMPRADLTMVSGRGKLGKSHMALQLACAIACGCPEHFLQTKAPRDTQWVEPAKTMFATWEDNYGAVQRRIHRIGKTMETWFDRAKVRENIIYRDMKPQGQIWIPQSESGHIANRGFMSNPGHDLLHSCQNEGVDFLILDSLVAVYGQDMNSAAHVRPFLNYISAWCNDTGITALLIAHPNRSGKGGASGSVDFKNGVRAAWTLNDQSEEDTGKDKEKADEKQYFRLHHFAVNEALDTTPDRPLIKEDGIWIHQPNIKKAEIYWQEYQQRRKATHEQPGLDTEEPPPDDDIDAIRFKV